VLLAPAGDPASAAMQELLGGLAAEAGLRLLTLPTITAAELADVQVVVALPPDPGLAQLAAAAPQTQFLAVGIAGVQPAGNVSVIAASPGGADQIAFLAGFTAASISEDWHTGVLYASGDEASKAAGQAFARGTRYFCGLCLPVHPPYPDYGYPIALELSPTATPAEWQPLLTFLASWQVETLFVDPALTQEALLADLAESSFNLILTVPPQPAWRGNWVATLGASDPLLVIPEVWAKLLQGEGGQQVSLPPGFAAVNPDLLSPGRQRLAEELLADLLAGLVDTR
ncbi:MAG: hypothetical protein L0Z70_09080, partial [Chloroflexi bacterium]|nr:hypothetical protein [Chloroflexota bacterium]